MSTSPRQAISAATLALALAAGAAQAHVTADPAEASAGGFQLVQFRVGHGCHDTAATTGVRIEIPAGLKTARPQPKPGWALRIDHDAAGAVTAVTWTGTLPADEFDQFGLYIRAPSAPGPLYFPAIQTCGAETERWTDLPDPAGGRSSHPAPVVRLAPAAAAAMPDVPGMPGMADSSHHH